MRINFKFRSILILAFAFLVMIQYACRKDAPVNSGDGTITLKWNKGYETDSLHKALIGLEWAFSHLGVSNTKAIYQMTTGNSSLLMDVGVFDFDSEVEDAFYQLHQNLRFSDEYVRMNSIDMGRYVALIIGAAEHYYAFVQMPRKYEDLLSQYNLRTDEGFVNNSLITDRRRIIKFSEQEGLNQFFVAEERDEITGVLIEYETIDMMANGQFRYGIYDEKGNLKTNSDPMQTEAGKPAKCMWCHESSVQPLFTIQLDFEGYFTYLQLRDTLAYYRETHRQKKEAIETGVDFSKVQDHAYMELLYTTFMEPSSARLALEWDMSQAKVEDLLIGIPTHINLEYPYLGQRYFRAEVNPFAPYLGLPVSSSAREQSINEVDYIN